MAHGDYRPKDDTSISVILRRTERTFRGGMQPSPTKMPDWSSVHVECDKRADDVSTVIAKFASK